MKEILIEQELDQNPTLNPPTSEWNSLNESITPTDAPLARTELSIWAESGLDIALTCVERVKGSLIRSAELFREEDSVRANRFFLQCVEGLQRFMEAIRNTKTAMQLDFAKIPTDMGSLSDTEKSLLFILRGMFQNQERKEYEEIADKIEYELLTNLSMWTTALGALRNSLVGRN
ncbi:MAG: hypothetical protein EBQ92_10795 [Proteobacteria bacterium]|nr:hypothetical protein [Pseudomonadota bacterium]